KQYLGAARNLIMRKSRSHARGTKVAFLAGLATFTGVAVPNIGMSSPAAHNVQPAVAPTAPVPTKPKSKAVLAYERFKALDGTWQAKSTKGWTDRVTYRVIAGGSAVMEMSFDAHPGEAMATMIHPDGEDLLM